MNACGEDRLEGHPVSRVVALGGGKVLGIVYTWNTGELSILWLHTAQEDARLLPNLSPSVIDQARSSTPDETLQLLCSMNV